MHSKCYLLLYGRKEGIILFNEALNTFYFTVIWRQWLYGVRHICSRTTQIAREETVSPIWTTFSDILFNDTLNTFYLRLYGVRHMVKDHSDSERGNPLPPHRLLLLISSKGYFLMHHPTDRITHSTAFVTPVVEHWLEREVAHWVHDMRLIQHAMSEHSYHRATSDRS